MIRLCAAVALACVAAAGSAPAEASPATAEQRARAAVAPLEVKRAVCITQSRRRTVCLLAHSTQSGVECRSTVVVRPRRARVIQSNVCFEFREVNP